MDDRIETLKQYLADCRKFVAKTAEVYDRARIDLDLRLDLVQEQWKSENAALISEYASDRKCLEIADSNLRAALIERYNTTQEKKYDNNLSVRISSKFQYENADAVEWAEKNAPILVIKSVDKKAFESLPQIEKLEFVYRHDTVTAVIAKEL